jgi:hypothetical protein
LLNFKFTKIYGAAANGVTKAQNCPSTGGRTGVDQKTSEAFAPKGLVLQSLASMKRLVESEYKSSRLLSVMLFSTRNSGTVW